MKIARTDSIIFLSGSLDERDQYSELLAVYTEALAGSNSKEVVFDFDKFTWCTSAGLVIWLRFMAEVETPLVFRKVPISIINHFNTIEGMVNSHTRIESFVAPFYSESLDDVSHRTFLVGVEVPLLADYRSYRFQTLTIDGHDYEPDFEPATYLHFLTRIHSHFYQESA